MIRRIPHDQLRDESIQLRGPSRHERRHPKAISYVSSDLAAERPARAAHVLHMTPARVDPQPGGRKCANARNFSRGDPTFYYVHTSEHPLRPPGCKGAPRRAHSAPCGPDGARTVFWQIPGKGKGLSNLPKHKRLKIPISVPAYLRAISTKIEIFRGSRVRTSETQRI